MQFLNLWLQGVVVAVIIATIIEMVLPNGNNKKYIKVILGIYVLFSIIVPIINKLSSGNFELSSIINIEEYTKKMENNTNNINSNIDKLNGENIKQVYISSLKNNIKANLQEKNYEVSKIEILVDNSENYNIEEISIYLKNKTNKKDENEIKKQVQYNTKINEIEKIEIQIGDNKVNVNNSEKLEEMNQVDENTKKEIKNYLANMYEINVQKINIY